MAQETIDLRADPPASGAGRCVRVDVRQPTFRNDFPVVAVITRDPC